MSLESSTILQRVWNTVAGREETIQGIHGGVKTLNQHEYHQHRGELYSREDRHILPSSGGYLDHLIVPSSSMIINLSHVELVAEGGPVDLYLYENPFTNVASYGTDRSALIQNHDRTYANSSGITLREDPFIDVNSLGTALDYAIQPLAGGGAIAGGGSARASEHAWTLLPGVPYLLRAANRDTSSGYAHIGMVFMVNSA